MTRSIGIVGLALAAGLVFGCAGSPPVATPAAEPVPPVASAAATAPVPAAEGPAPDDNLDAVLWTQRAVEHDLLVAQIYRVAGEKLAAALADPTWDALPREEREGPVDGLPPAVILDVDETVLDNSPYEAGLIRAGKFYDEFSWAQWCRRAAARALPGAAEFARAAAARGIAVFYISNRAKDLDRATLANLRQAGLPVADDGVFLGLGTVVPGCEQVGSDKSCRRRSVGRRYRVLGEFGDQLDDFVDVLSNTPDGRAASVAPYLSWIGERWWVLPNPMYGSWMPAQFHNDWSQPPGVRRRALVDSLRVP